MLLLKGSATVLGDKMKLYFTEREFVSGVKVAGTAAFPQQKHSVNTQNTNTESCQKKHIAQIHSACDLRHAQHNVKEGH